MSREKFVWITIIVITLKPKHKPKGSVNKEWAAPTELKYSIKESDGAVVNITINNIVFSTR